MLINCPRCEFQQPQDLYCANCGINIANFSSKNNSGILKFSRVKLAVASGALVLAGSAGYLLALPMLEQKTRKSTNPVNINRPAAQEASAISNSTETVSNAIAPSLASTSDREIPAEVTNSPSEEPHESAANETSSTQPQQATVKSISDSSASNGVNSTAGLNIKVAYLEVPKTTLAEFLNSHSNLQLEDMSDYSLGSVQLPIESILKLKGSKVLHSDSLDLTQARSQVWNKSKVDSNDINSFIGIRTLLEASDIDTAKKSAQVSFELQLNLRENNEPNPSNFKSFPANFDISKNNSFLIIGVIPDQLDPKQNVEVISNNSPLIILSSPSYLQGQSEFMILIYLE